MKALVIVFRAALPSLLVSLTATGCAMLGASTSGQDEQKSPAEAWADSLAAQFEKLTEASRRHDGLFTVYQDTLSGAVHLAIGPDQLGKEFIHFMHTVDGVTAAWEMRGFFREGRIFSIRKQFDRIELVVENTGYHFDPESPLSRAARANISPAVVATRPIVGRDRETGVFLVEAGEIFLRETFQQVKPSPDPDAEEGQFTLGELSKEKTRYAEVRNYPLNTDIVVDYVYESPYPTGFGGPGVTDRRFVTIRMQHSLIQMPENHYEPRLADPRVGYFTDQIDDMTSTSVTPYRDLVQRWHLVKKDPGAALSEPVEPIVWWIENTTPVEYRETIRAAVLKWNEAFETAGFRNAIEVQIQPDDAEWDAGDLRFNVLRWTSSPEPLFGGYGPSFTNPRTGQILGADIMLEFVFITNSLREEELFTEAALSMEHGSVNDPRSCSLGLHLHQSALFGIQSLRAAGASDSEVRKLITSALYFLALHEVGHTLGLSHNMKSSQMLSPGELQDAAITSARGVTGSVMDYPAINLAPPEGRQADWYSMRPGPYDRWAIEYGYSGALPDATGESARLERILARSTDPALAFGNDADDMRSPGVRGIDPRVMINDMSSDAIGYAAERLALVDGLMGRVVEKLAVEGRSHHAIRNAYLILTGEQAWAAFAVSRYIGGIYIDRGMVGQPGATRPFAPVSRREQKRAMEVLAEEIFAPDAFQAPAELLARLQRQRRGFEFWGTTEDPKIHERALAIQASVLDHLLHPVVLARLTDARLYGDEYPVVELVGDIERAVFSADLRGNVNTFRQNLQTELVGRLDRIVNEDEPAYDAPSRSAALASLRSIQQALRSRPAGNAETQAHTRHLLFTIAKALDTSAR